MDPVSVGISYLTDSRINNQSPMGGVVHGDEADPSMVRAAHKSHVSTRRVIAFYRLHLEHAEHTSGASVS